MKKQKLELLVATGNEGKIRELKEFLADLPIALKDLRDIVDVTEVAETGTTFAENAAIKAGGYALQGGMWALADDSGLEVEALGGAPGIYSARYGGPETDFDAKIRMLLSALEDVPRADRGARFVCSIAVADTGGQVAAHATGFCEGFIANAPAGTGGFGYDPIFVPSGFGGTFGELSNDVKRQISHRARAYSQIMPFLRGLT